MWIFVLFIFIVEYLQKQKAYEGYEYDNGFTSNQTELMVLQGRQGANTSLPQLTDLIHNCKLTENKIELYASYSNSQCCDLSHKLVPATKLQTGN